MRSREKDKRRAGYGESGERWVERAEAKIFANRKRYKIFLITQPLRKAYGKLFTFSGNYRDALRTYFCDWSAAEAADMRNSRQRITQVIKQK
jgi:hypothetical protein